MAGRTVGAIGPGLCVLAAAEQGDTDADARQAAEKIAHLRIFEDEGGKMNRSVLETGGGILLVSNFTVAGDCRKGRRPSFDGAMEASGARELLEVFSGALRAAGVVVAEGVFGAAMEVEIINDGPVTLVYATRL